MYKTRFVTCANPEGGQGVRTSLENYNNIGFLSNTGPDLLKITKLPIQHSMLDHHRTASETPFKWRFAGGPLMARLWWYLDASPLHQTEKKRKKRCQSWTPSYKSFWIRACVIWDSLCDNVTYLIIHSQL